MAEQLIKHSVIVISSILTCVILIISNIITLGTSKIDSISVIFAFSICLSAIDYYKLTYKKTKGIRNYFCIFMAIIYSIIAIAVFAFKQYMVDDGNKILLQNQANAILSFNGIYIYRSHLITLFIIMPILPLLACIGFEIPWGKKLKHNNTKMTNNISI